VLVAYTDGCANIDYSYASLAGGLQGAVHGPSKCDSDPNAYKDTDKVSLAGLARQSCGKGLFSSSDPGFTAGCPAPSVVAVQPVDGATGVPTATTATATFDEPLTAAAISLADSAGRAVKGTSGCNSPCTTVTFRPSTRLRKATSYTAHATGSNASGQGSATWTFTTTK
jgi:hypothetical protein